MAAVDPNQLVQRLVDEVYNQGNLAAIAELYAPTVDLNDQEFSREALQTGIAHLPMALPGFQVEVAALSAAADLVMAHWTVRDGAFEAGGSEGTRASTAWTGVRLFQVREEKIVAEWYNWLACDRLCEIEALRGLALPQGFATS